MSPCLLLLGALVGCAPGARPAPQQPPADAWVAEDKVQHLVVSFAATGMAYGGARLAMERRPARAAAGGAALALGLGKELADVRAGGPFSLKDLVWDAAGIALGITLATRID